jgi:hypothetical protein
MKLVFLNTPDGRKGAMGAVVICILLVAIVSAHIQIHLAHNRLEDFTQAISSFLLTEDPVERQEALEEIKEELDNDITEKCIKLEDDSNSGTRCLCSAKIASC